MNRLKALTVGQSTVAIFLSGLAVALIFAIASLTEGFADRQGLARDRALVRSVGEVGDLVHALQRERGLTSAWLAAPTAPLEREMHAQRLRSDAALGRLGAGNATQERESRAGPDAASLRDRLDEVRATADAGRFGAAAYRTEMTERIADLIGGVARAAALTRSKRASLMLRDAAALMAAKDATGLERALGAEIVGRRLAGLDAETGGLRDQVLIRESLMTSFRLTADADAISFLDLWERSRAVHGFESARAALLAPAPGTAAVTLESWVAGADRIIDDLRALERDGIQRLSEVLDAEIDAADARLLGEIGFLAALTVLFGGFAAWMLRRLNASIRELVATICRLAVDAGDARVPACPQRDLDQVARALRILRAGQIERRRAAEAAERLRASVDAELDRVLEAAAGGTEGSRMTELGLDAHGATLARGVNRLLDQIERERRVQAS